MFVDWDVCVRAKVHALLHAYNPYIYTHSHTKYITHTQEDEGEPHLASVPCPFPRCYYMCKRAHRMARHIALRHGEFAHLMAGQLGKLAARSATDLPAVRRSTSAVATAAVAADKPADDATNQLSAQLGEGSAKPAHISAMEYIYREYGVAINVPLPARVNSFGLDAERKAAPSSGPAGQPGGFGLDSENARLAGGGDGGGGGGGRCPGVVGAGGPSGAGGFGLDQEAASLAAGGVGAPAAARGAGAPCSSDAGAGYGLDQEAAGLAGTRPAAAAPVAAGPRGGAVGGGGVGLDAEAAAGTSAQSPSMAAAGDVPSSSPLPSATAAAASQQQPGPGAAAPKAQRGPDLQPPTSASPAPGEEPGNTFEFSGMRTDGVARGDSARGEGTQSPGRTDSGLVLSTAGPALSRATSQSVVLYGDDESAVFVCPVLVALQPSATNATTAAGRAGGTPGLPHTPFHEGRACLLEHLAHDHPELVAGAMAYVHGSTQRAAPGLPVCPFSGSCRVESRGAKGVEELVAAHCLETHPQQLLRLLHMATVMSNASSAAGEGRMR